MQQIADIGNHAYMDDVSEAKKVLISKFGRTLFTIAKVVKLQIESDSGSGEGISSHWL